MGKIILNDGVEVADYSRPYVIAEVNSSHNGDTNVAKQMIDAAVEAGCDCVKFQSWNAQSLYSKTYYEKNPIAKRFVDKLSLSPEELGEMSDYCRSKGIGFSSTPYSEEEVDFLVSCKVPFIKIASMEINNLDFLDYIGRKQVPVVLSTGMAESGEVDRAVKTLEKTGNKDIILLHCVSIYPAELETINLNNINGLRKKYPAYPIGFSDHTLGESAAIASVALGAAVIEKHLTLDSKKIGMDNQMAMEPADLKALVTHAREISIALGSEERTVSQAEYAQRLKMRRSVVAAHDIPKDSVIARSDLIAKRPGDGIPADQMDTVVGKRALCNIPEDTVVKREDIE